MNDVKTYTPTNFRKNIYKLLNQVKNNKDIKITLRPRKSGSNTDVLVINQVKFDKLFKKVRELEKDELARKIDLLSSQISTDNPIFSNPVKFEAWCEKTDD